MTEIEVRKIRRDLEDIGVTFTTIASELDRTSAYVSAQLRRTVPAPALIQAIEGRLGRPIA